MNLRCTAKLLKLLSETRIPEPAPTPFPEWYANLLWIERRKCLLFTQENTLFSFLVPNVKKADLSPIGPFFLQHLVSELANEGLPSDIFGPVDPTQIKLGKTRNRSVLGSMNDFALHCWHWAATAGGLDSLDVAGLNHQLRRTPMGALKYAYPLDKVKEQAWIAS